jgi:peptidoglycan-associated lipoprotein
MNSQHQGNTFAFAYPAVFKLWQTKKSSMKILKLIPAVILLFISAATFAQRGVTYNADKAFDSGDYYDAITLYKKAYTKEKNKPKKAEIIFKVAESYRKTNDYKNQEVWYGKAVKAKIKNPNATLYLAHALKYNGKYDEAIVQYEAYKKLVPEDPAGDLGVQSATQAQKWKDRPTRFKVENVAPINTKYSDFAAAYSNKDKRHIIYTSARAESMGKNDDGGTGEKFQDLFEATVDKKGKWSVPRPLLEPLNTTDNDGAASLNVKGETMYFTRCVFGKDATGVCEIYFTKRNGSTWDEPKLINLGPDSIVVGQPSLSADEQQLYFVSNMPGGQGGYDIWKSSWDKAGSKWGTPVNLGSKINSPEDEMFPFIATDGTLYFSSKGHVGMGGLDIFRSKMSGSSWDEPLNLKYPANTSADDFAYISDETGETGFLSSNREGGKGSDDIYKWTLPPLVFSVSGKVYDADSKANIEGARIEIFASDGSNIPYNTDKTGSYKFDLKPETDYKLVATVPSYLSKQYELSTKGLETSKDFIGDFDFALKSTLKAIELPNILYDLGKWDLRPESKKALDGLIQIMNDNPTIVIELGSHTDSRPIPMSNDTLSQRRAESVVNYLIEKGIDPGRLSAKGYGQHQPRTLYKDIGAFKSGDVLTDAFINNLKKPALKEEAHQLNRRTEFKVLRTNFIKTEGDINKPVIEIVDSGAPEVQPENIIIQQKTEEVPTKVEIKEVVKTTGDIYVATKKDTYSSIAKSYNMDVKTLKALNNLKSELIYEGMELKVTPDGDYTEYDKKFYTLDKDDKTWKDVAKKTNLKDTDLKKMNKNVDEDQFRVGKKIRIAK